MLKPGLSQWTLFSIFLRVLFLAQLSTSKVLDGHIGVNDLIKLLTKTKSEDTNMVYNFDDIEPTGNLEWVPCFDNFTCANLEVPLDYKELSAGYTNIAFIKNEGRDPNAEDIIVNPGGPGGSGVNYVRKAYHRIRSEGPGLGWRYNLIGFDPRGVKNSGPNLDCFVNNEFARKLYFSKLYEADGEGTVSQGSKYLPPEFAEAEALGKFCSEVHRNGDAGYAGTAAVAQDLWHFIQVRAASQGRRANRATLNYYGASYGTVIGSTFAALYPNRVRRMILDGVVDANVWYQGLDFGDFRQADECVESFFDTCYMAGLRCAFNKGAKSREEIRDRFDAVLKDLEAYPIPVFNPRLVSMPVVVTIDHIRDLVFDALYNPTKSFPRVAAIFEELERRDATLFVKSKGLGQVTMKTMEGMCSLGDGVIDSQKESRDNRKKKPRRESTMETLIIPAIDAHGRYNVSNTAMWNEHKRLRVRPKYHTEVLMQGPPFYRALSISPPKSQMFDGSKFAEPIKTLTPILFLTNLLDPITPCAQKMSTHFTDSVVLTANATGHCMSASDCSRHFVKRYLTIGELPPKDLICDVEKMPFLTKIEAKRYNEWFDDDSDDERSFMWL